MRFIRDLDIGPATNCLVTQYRKIYRDKCQGVRVEVQSFCDSGKRMTRRFNAVYVLKDQLNAIYATTSRLAAETASQSV